MIVKWLLKVFVVWKKYSDVNLNVLNNSEKNMFGLGQWSQNLTLGKDQLSNLLKL